MEKSSNKEEDYRGDKKVQGGEKEAIRETTGVE